MNLLLKKIEEKFSKIEFFLLMVSGITVIFSMLLITIDVIMRNVFNKPIAGVIEMMNIALIIIVALGFSYVQGKKENIMIEIATSKLPAIYKNLLDLTGYIIGFLVMAVIAWKSGVNAVSSFSAQEHTMGLIKIPLWPSKVLLTIGIGVLSIRLLLDSLLMLTNIKKIEIKPEYIEDSTIENKSIS
ncbi:MAG: TRAP transporter small permease [Neobacillus sp.]